jgi:5-methylcytosine-specific restriction protein A
MTRAAYHHLYNTPAWSQRRVLQLLERPLCEDCARRGRTTAATVADHVEPHKGDPDRFFHGALQSLCKPCHDIHKQSFERTGRMRGCDEDGRPLDPNHAWNTPDAETSVGVRTGLRAPVCASPSLSRRRP